MVQGKETLTWKLWLGQSSKCICKTNLDQLIIHVGLRDQLVHCTQMGAVTGYNSAFQWILLKCTDVSTSEALNRYIEGLKNEPRVWVQMQGLLLQIWPCNWPSTMISHFCSTMLQASYLRLICPQLKWASHKMGAAWLPRGKTLKLKVLLTQKKLSGSKKSSFSRKLFCLWQERLQSCKLLVKE